MDNTPDCTCNCHYIFDNCCASCKPKPISQVEQNFEKWWEEQIRLAQIFLGSGDYWVSKGIAKKTWIAAKECK